MVRGIGLLFCGSLLLSACTPVEDSQALVNQEECEFVPAIVPELVHQTPVNAVAWLANTLGALGIGLKAGEVILSGALAAMFPAKAGDSFRVSIGGLGGCSVRFH